MENKLETWPVNNAPFEVKCMRFNGKKQEVEEASNLIRNKYCIINPNKPGYGNIVEYTIIY